MKLSENIYRLRTEKRMSQGDLAEALEVSRQSVSKWETGSATPELDKLMKMAALFGITLDELVSGEQPQPEPVPVPAPTPVHSSQRTWGIILFCTGLALLIVLSLMGGFLTGLLLASPLLVPGIICLTAKKRGSLKCAWAEFFLITTYLSFATGTSWNTLLAYIRNWEFFMEHRNIFHPIVSGIELICLLILLICTVRSFNKEPKSLTERQRMLLLAGWIVYLLRFIPLQLPIDIFSPWYRIVGELINWSELALLTALLVFTWRLPWFQRRKI